MKRLSIALDMDAILSDLLKSVLEIVNKECGTSYTKEDITDYHIRNIIKEADTDAILKRPGVYRNLEPIPGALWAARELHNDGHDVLILTSPGKHFGCVPEKAEWLDEHLPFLFYRRRMFTSAKEMTTADVYVDDGPDNIQKIREKSPDAAIFAIAYPYNKSVEGLCARVEGYQNYEKAWRDIVRSIRVIATGDGLPVRKAV